MPGSEPLNLLREIIEKDAYKNNYSKITSQMLHPLCEEKLTYTDCIQTLEEIIQAQILPEKIK